jgi:hypothetical protein
LSPEIPVRPKKKKPWEAEGVSDFSVIIWPAV